MAAERILKEEVGQLLAQKIKANTTAIETLNGSGDGSVSKTVADQIAALVNSAPESFDTLKEISDWISTHSSDASAMNTRITDNETAIAALQAAQTTVDSALSTTSENPVQNKVVKAALDTLETAVSNLESNALTVDSALSDTSENPVQNKVIKAALDAAAAQYELVTATEAEAWFTPATP